MRGAISRRGDKPPRKPIPLVAEFFPYLIGAVVVTPLAKPAWDALSSGNYALGLLLLAVAVVAAALAFSLKYWESHLAEPVRVHS
jgi:hypothetical protein